MNYMLLLAAVLSAGAAGFPHKAVPLTGWFLRLFKDKLLIFAQQPPLSAWWISLLIPPPPPLLSDLFAFKPKIGANIYYCFAHLCKVVPCCIKPWMRVESCFCCVCSVCRFCCLRMLNEKRFSWAHFAAFCMGVLDLEVYRKTHTCVCVCTRGLHC